MLSYVNADVNVTKYDKIILDPVDLGAIRKTRLCNPQTAQCLPT